MATPHVTQVPVLDREVVRHNYKCGLPDEFNWLHITTGYAQLNVTEEEFIHYFLGWSPEIREKSRQLLNDIANAVKIEIARYS